MFSPRQEYLVKTLMRKATELEPEYLCKKLSVSGRTLREDVKEINEFLHDYGVGIYLSSTGKYYISEDDKDKINQIIVMHEIESEWVPESKTQREFYIIMRLLYEEDYLTMDEIGKEIYVSKASISHDVKRIDDYIFEVTKTRMDISKAKGIRLLTNELGKRRLLFSLIYKNYDIDAKYLMKMFIHFQLGSREEFSTLWKIYEEFFEQNELISTHISFATILLETIACTGRIRQGYVIEDYDREEVEFKLALPFERIEDTFHMVFPKAEKQLLQEVFHTKRMLVNQEEVTPTKFLIRQILVDFVEVIKEKYEIDLEQDYEQMKQLKAHLNAMVSRLLLSYHEDEYIAGKIKSEYPKEYEMAAEITPIIKKYLNLDITEVEQAYIAMHVGAIVEHLKKTVHAIIISNSTAVMIQMLQKKLQQSFYGQLVVDGCFPVNQLEFAIECIPQIDVILATHSLKKKVDIPVLKLNEFYEKEDWVIINDFINS
ncbi:transcriptional antiterminator of lichenan operon, BglG family [Lachnospiraceae bacterium KM106-2]|nr:transcriptional antiterminator of lichenan operon, BglG family [Lachnospiraceae bacterium KM106-2]